MIKQRSILFSQCTEFGTSSPTPSPYHSPVAETCNGAVATNMYTEREQILSAVFGTIIFILLLLIAGENLFLVIWFISKRRHSNKRSISSVEPTSNPSATSTATMRSDNSVYYTTVKDVDSTQSKMGANVVMETNPCYQSVEPDMHRKVCTYICHALCCGNRNTCIYIL